MTEEQFRKEAVQALTKIQKLLKLQTYDFRIRIDNSIETDFTGTIEPPENHLGGTLIVSIAGMIDFSGHILT